MHIEGRKCRGGEGGAGRTVDGGSVKGLMKGSGKNVFIIDCWCDVTVVSNSKAEKKERRKTQTWSTQQTDEWLILLGTSNQHSISKAHDLSMTMIMTWPHPTMRITSKLNVDAPWCLYIRRVCRKWRLHMPPLGREGERGHPFYYKMCLWWSSSTFRLLTCQVRVTVVDPVRSLMSRPSLFPVAVQHC